VQIWRKENDLRHARLYGNQPLMGFGLANYARPNTLNGSKVGLNVVKNCSDAFTAQVTKDKPKVTFLTSGGDWDLQNRARELEKFVDGQFYELDLYNVFSQVVLDACIWGNGFLKFFVSGEGEEARIHCNRVFPWEIIVDDQEGLYCEPRNLYQRRWVDRLVLLADFGTDGALRKKICEAKRDTDDVDGFGYDSTADQVLVTEAWHLPSKMGEKDPKKQDGRHTIAIENTILWDEQYDQDHFPFVVYRRQKPPLGYWGIGLAEELQGLQLELNTLMQKVQKSFHFLGYGHWFVENSSKVNTQKIDNDISIIRYTGERPHVEAADPISEQIFEHIERIKTNCYEITGISQLQAQSQKPKGLNSGKAIDSYLDITTERFNVSLRIFQQCFIDSAKMVLELSRVITERYNPDFDVVSPDKGGKAAHVHFKKNELRDDEYILQLFLTNKLSDEPSERMQQVQSMAEAGWIDAQDAKRLLDFPDLQRAADLDNASYDAVESCISRALKEGVYKTPQPYLNLAQGMRQVQMALIRGWVDNVPEDRLKLLRQWLLDAQELLTRAMPPPPPPAMPGLNPGLPPGMPGAPPPPMPGTTQFAPMPIMPAMPGQGMPMPQGGPQMVPQDTGGLPGQAVPAVA
jgi:hypothetical protein